MHIPGQRTRGVDTEQRLAATCQRHDARCGGLGQAVHLQRLGAARDIGLAVFTQQHRAQMQAGAGLQRVRQRCQGSVVRGSVGDSVGGALEHQQHAVGLVDLQAVVRRQQVACDAVVGGPQLGHGRVAQGLRQLRAVDHVGEQQRALAAARRGRVVARFVQGQRRLSAQRSAQTSAQTPAQESAQESAQNSAQAGRIVHRAAVKA